MELSDRREPIGSEIEDNTDDNDARTAEALRREIICCNAAGAITAIALLSCIGYLAYVDCENLAFTIFVNTIFASYQLFLEIICIYGILYNNSILFKIKYFDPGVSIVAAIVLSVINGMQSMRDYPQVVTGEPLKLWHYCICGIYAFFMLVEMLHVRFLCRYYAAISVDGYAACEIIETEVHNTQDPPESASQRGERDRTIDAV